MQNHMKKIISYGFMMPQKMPLHHLDTSSRISFSLGISFSATITENLLQSRTSPRGGTKLSAIITGTHS
ncbi:uncharacterized protein [Aristolochia californica]|uniref:uncharacterized protein n=1 Tax=Aristolochia californica TaxID=171875 RepID=UPI0035D78F79